MVTQATVTDPKGNAILYSYSGGEVVGQTHGYGNAQASTWRYAYDPATLGRISTVDPNGNTTNATYDSHGNQTSITDSLGRTTTRTYNAHDDLTTITEPRPTGRPTW